MISVENRVPNPGQEGRVLITPESGSPFYATLAMADGATQPGTPWNRNTGNLLQADIRNYPIASGQTVTAGQVVDVTSDIPPTVVQYVPGSIQVQNVPVGSFITRTENGVPQYYLVVHQGLPSEMYDASCNGTWVLRLDIYENAAWDADNSNVLPGADIFTTMAGMLSLFDAETQAAIKTVKIPYCVGGGKSTVQSGADGLECQIFPLSITEVNVSFPAAPLDGSALSFFSIPGTSKTKAAIFQSQYSEWVTRSPSTGNSIQLFTIKSSGVGSAVYAQTSTGIRPAFILDPTLEVDGYYEGASEAITTSGTSSQAIALQGGSAGDTIPVIFSGVAQLSGVTQGQQITSPGVQGFGALDGWLSVFPYWTQYAKVATGSYQGTGTYGSNHPTSIILPFAPKLVIISSGNLCPQSGYWIGGVIWSVGMTSTYTTSSAKLTFVLSEDDYTLSWYTNLSGTPNADSSQLNGSGTTYYYMAIG